MNIEFAIAYLKKPIVFIPFIAFVLILAVFATNRYFQRPMPSQDQGLDYGNADLGFSYVLPSEFIYFQTQRINKDKYTDLEIFVPTSDTRHAQEVPGYAKPIVVRVFDRKFWDETDKNDSSKQNFLYQGIKNDRAYAIKLWDTPPADWESKWNNEMKERVLNGFKLE
jgi:hypothetical protein